MTERRVIDPESKHEVILDPEIPGQIGWQDMIAMARLAKNVPRNGIIVETGPLFGRSSFVWSMNSDPTVRVFCIDPWVREKWIIELVEKAQNPAIPFSLKAFRHYTKKCKNITAIKGYSPSVVERWWSTAIDLYYDDSDHAEPGLSRNWDFWIQWVKPGGIVCGDDYVESCPDVVRKVDAMASSWETVPGHAGLFWWMIKPGPTQL